MEWEQSKPEEDVLTELRKAKQKDYSFSSSRILGSMCTMPHPLAAKAYTMFLETNMGDPELFPGTTLLEDRVIAMAAELLHAPPTYGGKFVSGGTEGNLMTLQIAQTLAKKKEVVVPESAHFSFQKASSLLGLTLKVVSSGTQGVDIEQVKDTIGKNTLCVVGVAGTTGLGIIDPISELGAICEEKNIFFHVDAAFGGFVIPFLRQLDYPTPQFDFSVSGVSSVTLDPHKMGCSVIPSGLLLVRQKKWFDRISVISSYISLERQSSILGTRPGAAVAATYAVMRHLGKKGYCNIVRQCMDVTNYAKHRLIAAGIDLVTEPQMNVLGISVSDPTYISKELAKKQWKIGFDKNLKCLRLVIMPHIKKRLIDKFVIDLKEVMT